MLELFGSGLISLWLDVAGIPQKVTGGSTSRQAPVSQPANQLFAWEELSWLLLPDAADSETAKMVKQYLKGLSSKGMAATGQGVWIQAGPALLANHQGTVPLPAASLTKIATSLVALETWGPYHEFETLIGATGPIQDGVLKGDLVIQGQGDPLFIWEEGIALGNSLNQLGIRQVTGKLIITGNFAMNYETHPLTAGELLKQALNHKLWTEDENFVYSTLPPGTPKPEVAIAGGIQVGALNQTPAMPVPKQILLLRHQSLPLVEILRQMNIYSNNPMSEMLAEALGGAQIVAQRTAAATGIPIEEIQLINGSGLGQENRISPRAATAMLMRIHRYLQAHSLNIADLFPVSGRDEGTLIGRRIPQASVVKTGTLWDVSALAGVFPTRDRGLVWFTIINRGDRVDDFRAQQDALLQQLVKQWGAVASLPETVVPTPEVGDSISLGDPLRNHILYQPKASL